MVTRNEIIDLLTLAAVYDQRNADEADVQGWLAVAEIENWTATAARRVVIEHYCRGADRPRITPAAITDRLREAHRKAANSFSEPEAIDGESGREYVERRRRLMREHIARVMDAWATRGESIPEGLTELEARRERRALTAGPDLATCPEHLREQVARDLSRAGRESDDLAPPVRLPRRPTGDPGRRAAARAELDALRESRQDEGGVA